MDIYFARQLVLERIMAAKERLPEGLEPVMAPVTTGLGEVYHYYVEGPTCDGDRSHVVETELTDQRTMQDWVLRPLLKGVPGVIDVNGMGGFVKQYQVLVDPAKLRKFDLTLHEIYEAVAKNNANAGGNVLERHAERSIVRGLGPDQDRERYRVHHRERVRRHAGLRARCRGSPHRPRRSPWCGGPQWGAGGRDRDGAHASRRQCASGGRSGQDQGGGSAAESHPPRRHEARCPFYDRIELVTAAINTVRDALIEGIVLVVFVFFFFLGHVRSAIVVTVSLIVTPLITFIVMQRLGLSANLMTLGGLAIAIGEIADGSLVVVENVYRHLAQNNGATRKSKRRGDSPGHERSGPADPLRHSDHQRRLPAAHDASWHGRERCSRRWPIRW